MTGAEHFAMAESLLEEARTQTRRGEFDIAARCTARAQVHAMLAMAHAQITETGGWER